MKSIRRISIAIAVIGITLAGFFNWPSQRVRRQVDFWAYDFRHPSHPPWPLTEREVVRSNALRSLGPRAIKMLIADAERSDNVMDRLQRSRFSRYIPTRFRGPGTYTVRYEAVRVLINFGHDAEPAIPMLLRKLNDPVEHARMHAALTLGEIGAPRENVIAALEQERNGKHRGSALAAAVALWRLGHTNAAMVDFVNASLGTSTPIGTNFNMRLVHNYLGTVGPAARPFAHGLRSSMTNELAFASYTWGGFEHPAEALWRIEQSPDAALSALRRLTNDVNSGRMTPPIRAPWQLIQMTRQLGVVPEFCVAVKPLLDQIDINQYPQCAPYKSNALLLVERTLRTTGTSANQ